jgi:hypothetical protein
MSSARTLTLDDAVTADGAAWVLTGVHHPDPARLGGRVVVPRGETLTLGRDAAAGDGLLDDPSVSRRHARVEADDAALLVTDLGSSNGTWRGEARVTEALLRSGDALRLGGVVLLARRVVHTKAYGLSTLAAKLGLPARRWHRAGEDVAGVRDLFAHVTGVLRPASARDLWEVRVGQEGPVRVRTAFEELFARAQGGRRALSLLVRTPGHEPVTLVARVERWSPPYLHLATGQRGAHGVRVLRADRVLYAEEAPAKPR